MKVVVDSNIPFIRGVIEHLVDEVVYAEGKDFSPSLIRDADALIIRTRTRCNRALLEGSRVRFIATATIGFDHIDAGYCHEAGIVWSNAPGCNAASVAQYITSVLLLLQHDKGLSLQGACLGVVGVGHVGSLVVKVGEQLGMRVLQCDPPRAANGEQGFLSLETLVAQCDVISFHTPLVRCGAWPTYHLADANLFAALTRPIYLINTSRGEVVDNEALLLALQRGTVSGAVLDVWEHEPEISRELLQRVVIGTPHIAGYSADGKSNAARMALDALCRFFNLHADYQILPPPPAQPLLRVAHWSEAQLLSYNPYTDSRALKSHPEQFEYLRGHYPLRRELSAYSIEFI